MNWITIYISGKSDFREDVRRKLEHSDVNFMPGYLGNSALDVTHDMYWVDDTIPLRTFKEAVSGKLVWKHRLRFYTSLEAFLESQENTTEETEFTTEELNLISEMQDSEKHQHAA